MSEPISVRERIEFLDVLRGFALFGVLAANMRGFNAPMQIYNDIDRLFSGMLDIWGSSIPRYARLGQIRHAVLGAARKSCAA